MKRSSLAMAATALLLGGCSSLQIDAQQRGVAQFANANLGATAGLHQSALETQRAQAAVEQLLAAPLTADAAVQIALLNSAALQALLADNAAASADATQSARLPNPVLTFERLLRREDAAIDKDIGRMLGFGLLELLTLPQRTRSADAEQRKLALSNASAVLSSARGARAEWIKAVAAQQSLQFVSQVQEAADASAELARRMQAVGNFSRLQRARQQAFYADATAQLARAEHASTAARESLVRALGLNAAQAARLRLAERLPDLPNLLNSNSAAAISSAAFEQRLDVRMAQAELASLAARQGSTQLQSWLASLHLAAVRNSETGRNPQKGWELDIALPLFDLGDAWRAGANAQVLAAVQRQIDVNASATSQLREAASSAQTAYLLAKHYRDEIVPLRKTILDEMLLKYNGMLSSVFDLLAETRLQSASVIEAINALRDFYLADAALKAAVLGQPGTATGMAASSSKAAAADAGAH